MHHFHIYRFDPDSDAAPRMQAYDLEVGDGERMLLDALIKLKAIDPSLSFRRSCREGICGSFCRPVASWSTVATRRQERGSTTSRIPTDCFAAGRC